MISTAKTVMVRFGANGRVVIPGRLLKEFGIAEGTEMSAISTPDGILLRPLADQAFIKSLRGKYRDWPLMETLQGMKLEEKRL